MKDNMDNNWKSKAACKNKTTQIFYCDSPDKGINLEREAQAKSICRKCPVVAECLLDAINRKESYGIWGSFAPKERNTIVNLFEKESIDINFCKTVVNREIRSIKVQSYNRKLVV